MRIPFLLFFLFLSAMAVAQRAIPPLWGHSVHDEAHILSQQAIDELELMLKAYEDSTSNQIALLIIPSLEGDPIEEYGVRVAQEWKLGKEKEDNGVLLLIAVDDRKTRIEVGYGLEGVLTDAATSQIIRNEIAPHFRQQNYETGVIEAVKAIIQSIGNEYQAQDPAFELDEYSWGERILVGCFIFFVLGIFTFAGLFSTGCSSWFLYAFLIPFYAIFPRVAIGNIGGLALLGIYVIGFPVFKVILSRTPWGQRMIKSVNQNRGSGGGSSGGGWYGGGWSGGSGSGSGWSSGGGGFSGGGGSFGGGGSSGSW